MKIRIADTCAVLLVLLSLAVLLGWAAHTTALIQVFPGLAPMQVDTALGFLLIALALLAANHRHPRLALLAASLAALGSALTLMEHVLSINLGMGDWLIAPLVSDRTMVPGRMSPATAITMLISAVTLLFRALHLERKSRFPIVTSSGGLIIAFAITHLVNLAADPQGLFSFHGMALHTIAAFLVVGCGIIALVHPELVFYLAETERQYADSAEARSWERMMTVFNQLPVGVSVKNPSGELTFTNQQYKTYQQAAQEAASTSAPHPSALHMHELLGDGIPSEMDQLEQGQEVIHPDLSMVLPDGSTTWFHLVKVPLRHNNGVKAGIIGVLENITVRKNAEEALRTTQDRYATIVEQIEDAVITVNAEMQITLFNSGAERIFGYARDEVLNHPVNMLVPMDVRTKHQKLVQNYVASQGTARGMNSGRIVRGLHKDGSTFPVEAGLFRLNLQGQDLYTVLVRDVTKQVTAKEAAQRHAEQLQSINSELAAVNLELKQSNEELGQFAYVASHDLQEPLRKLQSFSKLLRDDLQLETLPDDAEKDLEIIESSATRMRSLVNALLSFARLGRASLAPSAVDLNDSLNAALAALDLRIAESGATVEREALPTVQGDPQMLTQLFQNLIDNALKFSTATAPRVRVTAQQQGGQWIIGIADNGIGIPERFHTSVFEPFSRLHSRAQYDGSGIGLAICRKVVELHDGKIWVVSKEGEGAHFHFTLNSAAPAAA